MTTAMQHLASGKRHLLVKEVSAACEAFSQAVQLMNELYGETAPECAEAYFSYGRALLEMARMERGVIENVDEAGGGKKLSCV